MPRPRWRPRSGASALGSAPAAALDWLGQLHVGETAVALVALVAFAVRGVLAYLRTPAGLVRSRLRWLAGGGSARCVDCGWGAAGAGDGPTAVPGGLAGPVRVAVRRGDGRRSAPAPAVRHREAGQPGARLLHRRPGVAGRVRRARLAARRRPAGLGNGRRGSHRGRRRAGARAAARCGPGHGQPAHVRRPRRLGGRPGPARRTARGRPALVGGAAGHRPDCRTVAARAVRRRRARRRRRRVPPAPPRTGTRRSRCTRSRCSTVARSSAGCSWPAADPRTRWSRRPRCARCARPAGRAAVEAVRLQEDLRRSRAEVVALREEERRRLLAATCTTAWGLRWLRSASRLTWSLGSCPLAGSPVAGGDRGRGPGLRGRRPPACRGAPAACARRARARRRASVPRRHTHRRGGGHRGDRPGAGQRCAAGRRRDRRLPHRRRGHPTNAAPAQPRTAMPCRGRSGGRRAAASVSDDGRPRMPRWSDPGGSAGVGLQSMRERAAEVGGACSLLPAPGRHPAEARLPLALGDGP